MWAVQVTILDVVDLKNPGAHGLHWGRAAEDPLSPMCMYLPGGHGSDGGMRVCHEIICLDHNSLVALFVFRVLPK